MIREELLHSTSENTSKLNKMITLKRISEDLKKKKLELETEKSDEEKKLGEIIRRLEIIITDLELFLQILNSNNISRGVEIGATLNPNSILENLAILPTIVPDLSYDKNELFYIRMKEEYNSKVKSTNKIANIMLFASVIGAFSIPNFYTVGASAILTVISRRFVDNRIKEAIPKLQSIATEELELKRQELNSIKNISYSKQEILDELNFKINSVDKKIEEIYLQFFKNINEERLLENELWRRNIDCIEESKVKKYEIRNKSWKSLKQ